MTTFTHTAIISRATNLRSPAANVQQIVAVMPRSAVVQVQRIAGTWAYVNFVGRNREGWCVTDTLINLYSEANPTEKNYADSELNTGHEVLLTYLRDSNYETTEKLARRLADQLGRLATADAQLALLKTLLHEVKTATQSLWRRNVLRVFGRIFEQYQTRAEQPIAQFARTDAMTDTLRALLRRDTTTAVLHDVLWILDSYAYPCFVAQGDVQQLIRNTSLDSAVRFRAMGVWRRLMYAKTGALTDAELNFLLAQMNDSDEWVRAEGYFCCEVLKPEHLPPAHRTRVMMGLENAWQHENAQTIRPNLARAIDHFNGNQTLLKTLRMDYEQRDLPNEVMSADGQTKVRSSLPLQTLNQYVLLLERQKKIFFELMGGEFHQPLSGDPSRVMTLIVYGSREVYRQHMSGFVGFGADAGGLYIEQSATLYTFEHDKTDAYSTEDLIKHEYGHYLQGRYVYPGMWGEAGYHHEPKGWADEGMAEFLAGISIDSAGQYELAEREVYVKPEKLCNGDPLCDLNALIRRREGYEQQNGTQFDYMNGWALVHYLMKERREIALKLYSALRRNTYRADDFERICGVSLAQLQADWHAAMRHWCANRSDAPAGDTTTCMLYRIGDGPMPALPQGASGEAGQPTHIVRLVR
ncbi:MAG: collagenase [Anaerolineae bacterium]|nr:collagenase [Anaerolineae bacterium]